MVLVLTSLIGPFSFHLCCSMYVGLSPLPFFKPLSHLSSAVTFYFPIQCGQLNPSDFSFSITASFCSSLTKVPYINWLTCLCIYIPAFFSSSASRILMLLKSMDNILRDKMLCGPLPLSFMIMWSTSPPTCSYLTSHSDCIHGKVPAAKHSCNSAAESKEESQHHTTSQLSISHQQVLHRPSKMNDSVSCSSSHCTILLFYS